MSDTKATPEGEPETATDAGGGIQSAPQADAPGAAAAPDAEPAPPAPPPSFESVWADVMPRWLLSHVANSPISRETAAFNHLVETALPALRQAIKESL